MPFRLENAPPTYQWALSMAFKEYLGVFMKLFLDNFNVLSDLKINLIKLRLCFDKCWEFNISHNSKNCMFLVFSGVILGYIMFKERRILDLKEITAIVNMPELKTPKDIQVFNNMAKFYHYFIHNFISIMALITKLLQKTQVFHWILEC